MPGWGRAGGENNSKVSQLMAEDEQREGVQGHRLQNPSGEDAELSREQSLPPEVPPEPLQEQHGGGVRRSAGCWGRATRRSHPSAATSWGP